MAGIYNSSGPYSVRIKSANLTEAKTGTPQVQIQMEILKYKGKDSHPFTGRLDPICFLAITDQTMKGESGQGGWVKQTLEYLGFNGDFDTINEQLIDIECDAFCSHEEFNGEDRERWTINRDDGQGINTKPADKKKVRSLKTKYGKMFTQENNAGTVGKSAEKDTDDDGDDIPF